MSVKEKYFLKSEGHSRNKSVRRNEFVSARSQFDRYLRSRQREYRNKVIDEIDSACTKDPRKFWDHIKHLGPKKKVALPETVRTANGLSNEPSVV